jgi:hypothetical protein
MIKNVFGWVTEITTSKRPWSSFSTQEQTQWNSYMVHRVISMTPDYIDIANAAQKMLHTDHIGIYNFYCNIIPKKKVWNKYIKSTVKTKNKELLEIISNYFEVGYNEANHYIDIMGKDEVKNILLSMGKEKKEITKLFK